MPHFLSLLRSSSDKDADSAFSASRRSFASLSDSALSRSCAASHDPNSGGGFFPQILPSASVVHPPMNSHPAIFSQKIASGVKLNSIISEHPPSSSPAPVTYPSESAASLAAPAALGAGTLVFDRNRDVWLSVAEFLSLEVGLVERLAASAAATAATAGAEEAAAAAALSVGPDGNHGENV